MAKKEVFYVDVEERTFITVAVEAEDDMEAEEIAEAYVVANVLPSEMYLLDHAAIAYAADEQPRMAQSSISIHRELDPGSAITRDFKRTIEGYIGWQGLSADEIMASAQTALDDIRRVLTARPSTKIGM